MDRDGLLRQGFVDVGSLPEAQVKVLRWSTQKLDVFNWICLCTLSGDVGSRAQTS